MKYDLSKLHNQYFRFKVKALMTYHLPLMPYDSHCLTKSFELVPKTIKCSFIIATNSFSINFTPQKDNKIIWQK
jgi:hypothetical protein